MFQDIIDMFLPGFIFITFYNWITNKKMDIYVIGIWSLVINSLIKTFYSALHIYVLKNVNFEEPIKVLIYVFTALALPLLVVKISESKYVKFILKKTNHKSIYDNVFDAVIDREKRTIMSVYLKNTNVVYIGTYKFNEENGSESYIVLINYASYLADSMETIIDTEKENLKSSVTINLRDIDRIELLYENDSKVWKWLNDDNIEQIN